jgi:hypothetical protein
LNIIGAPAKNSKKLKTEPEEVKEEPVVKNDIIAKLREAEKNDKRPRVRIVDKHVPLSANYSVRLTQLQYSLVQGVPFFFAYFLVNLFLQLETNMVM